MIDSTRISNDAVHSSEGDQHLDEMLGRYFRTAMPEPWPACPQPADTNQTVPASLRHRNVLSYRRLAVVAATLALVVGYHALLGSLPDPQLSTGLKVDSSQPMGMRLMPDKIIDIKLDGKPATTDADVDPKKVILKK